MDRYNLLTHPHPPHPCFQRAVTNSMAEAARQQLELWRVQGLYLPSSGFKTPIGARRTHHPSPGLTPLIIIILHI